ncbi:hypothetical protein CHS0354_037499 [Potamilus streckersoni]|uniref:Uncharacterized protein n=1 Tax=Potamilus streckersoni TaxID=2493646 RepID=A0AAE0RP57_9BIVA|nr:hypothetical protein CHS0354_037499 [Potamilus streckersoni]
MEFKGSNENWIKIQDKSRIIGIRTGSLKKRKDGEIQRLGKEWWKTRGHEECIRNRKGRFRESKNSRGIENDRSHPIVTILAC